MAQSKTMKLPNLTQVWRLSIKADHLPNTA